MRSFLFLTVSSLATLSTTSARIHSLPEDTHAFPKFAVSFLNGHPLLNETAERWLKQGLRGGVHEFLDQPWKADSEQPSMQPKEIGSGDTSSDTPAPNDYPDANYTLEHMRMGPKDAYLCLMPKASETVSQRHQEVDTDPTPARSWSLLQPLSGTCLYHRQGWFTYSYCHNKEIRQFKELAQPQSRLPAGTYRPAEDPKWESYTLGRAPRSSDEPGAGLTLAERNAQAANLEMARNAGSQYLVQRWGDGTVCDKTGSKREIEVQFHCSMVMTDHILFVKETKTCSYVLVIHTPRLCGEPGFKSRRDAGENSIIRCREIVSSPSDAQSAWPLLPSGDSPTKRPRRKFVIPAPVAGVGSQGITDKHTTPNQDSGASSESSSSSTESEKTKEQLYHELVEKTIELLINKADGGVGSITGAQRRGANARVENGEVIIEYDDDDEGEQTSQMILEGLRAAGYEVAAEELPAKSQKQGDKDSSGSSNSKKGKNSKESKSRKTGPRWFGRRFEL